MALTQAQRAILEKARSLSGGGQGVALSGGACAFLVTVVARDLGASGRFPELPADAPDFFSPGSVANLEIAGHDCGALFERLVAVDPNADTYFACLAAMHKARLKYERILQTQPTPTIDQVGPRGLLQFGSMTAKALTGFLLWRKWIFDIDNRAGQETGYLFEPIIAAAIGGVPASAKKSPVRRRGQGTGRQVDCVRGDLAYEFKIRVTIAASGQGRWREELEFPEDCRASGYVPVLIVLDPTQNPKLDELRDAFIDANGEVYIGANAWGHLEGAAGPTMGRFLEKYVRDPIAALLAEMPNQMPDITFSMTDALLTVIVAGERFTIPRVQPREAEVEEADAEMPEDVDEGGP